MHICNVLQSTLANPSLALTPKDQVRSATLQQLLTRFARLARCAPPHMPCNHTPQYFNDLAEKLGMNPNSMQRNAGLMRQGACVDMTGCMQPHARGTARCRSASSCCCVSWWGALQCCQS